jgi:putative endonuclease
MHLERGRRWEDAAAKYLERQGLTVLARGYRCRLGELDLVCHDGRLLIIVEVRARATSPYGGAVTTIGPRKRARIILATRHLLMRHSEWSKTSVRFDVVTFDAIETPTPAIRWIRNAFDAS